MLPLPSMGKVARELKLSRMTVSSIVNDRFRERGISDETAQRVRAYIQKRGYVPSRQALDLKNGVRDSIGVLYGGQLYSHVTEAFNLLTNRFNASPRRLELMVVKRGASAQGIRELIARGVRQLVWIHTGAPETEFENAADIWGYLAHLKTVIYNFRFGASPWEKRLAQERVHLVGVNRQAGFQRLGAFLRSLGHRRIAIVAQEAGAQQVQAPGGFQAAGLEVRYAYPRGRYVVNAPESAAATAQAVVRAMRGDAVTAACFLDDEFAGLGMVELLRRGVRIPRDLTVTGYDGMTCAAFTPVPLTTLGVPVPAMVACVNRLLHQRTTQFRHCFALRLIRRASHGPRERVFFKGGNRSAGGPDRVRVAKRQPTLLA